MKKITIYGERCSGTNYLEQLLILNFDVEVTWNYGWKHFFGFQDLSHTDDILFICIVRNLYDWVNSLYREKHHLPSCLTTNIDIFLNDTFYSLHYDNNNNITNEEIFEDRNIETNERYKNIFELRRVKNKFLVEKLPTLVKNYCIITYDELTNEFTKTMNKLKSCGIKIKNNIEFPLNISYYKTDKNKLFIKKENKISKEKIDKLIIGDAELLMYEKLLFPNLSFI